MAYPDYDRARACVNACTDMADPAAEIERLRAEVKQYRDWPRCEECGGELTACGPMSIDGPEEDCRVCQLKSELTRLRKIEAAADEMRIFITSEGAEIGKFYSRDKIVSAYDAAKKRTPTSKS